jgi:GGDEF domain-containing protein
MLRRILPYLFPLLLLLAGAYLLAAQAELLRELARRPVFVFLPHIIFVLVFALGWRFNLARVAFLAVLAGGTLTALTGPLSGTGGDGLVPEDVRLVASLLLPLNFILFHVLRERGLANFFGLLRGLWIVAQLVLIALVPNAAAVFLVRILPDSLLQVTWSGWLDVPRLSGLIFLICVALLVLISRRHDYLSGPLLGISLLALFIGLNIMSPEFRGWSAEDALGARLIMGGIGLRLFFTIGSILLLYTVLELSYGNAFIDQLTGIPGRRAFDHRIAALGSTYAIAMVDIDHFKKVNDRYGHDTGDQALRFIAARLAAFKAGTAYRYGGEEFAIVMPRRTVKKVFPLLDDLRSDIAAKPFYQRGSDRPGKRSGKKTRGKSSGSGRRVPLTVSIGVAEPNKRHGGAPADIIIAADKALYRAKKKGRNRVDKG